MIDTGTRAMLRTIRKLEARVAYLEAEVELQAMMVHDIAAPAVIAAIRKKWPAVVARWDALNKMTSPHSSSKELGDTASDVHPPEAHPVAGGPILSGGEARDGSPDGADTAPPPPGGVGAFRSADAADPAGDDGKHGADLSPAELDFILTGGLAL
jgi:hypothetical protein